MSQPPGQSFGDGGLYTIADMRAADAMTIEGGMPGIDLMENAGKAVTDVVSQNFQPVDTVVLCGPGNNGGDGFVAARLLKEAGWPVTVGLLGDPSARTGDAAIARDRFSGKTRPIDQIEAEKAGLIIDALFGAGLARPIEGPVKALLEALNDLDVPVVAVDVPSGIDGDSGEIKGTAIKADITVTFHRAKPGHLLLPGRDHVGRLLVRDIGIPQDVDDRLEISTFANLPSLWRAAFPRRSTSSHKYSHGHALVLGGGMSSSGAARLAARAALRAGSGLVTVLCPAAALPVYAASLTAIMVNPFKDEAGFIEALKDPRRNAMLLGPGAGIGAPLRSMVAAGLAASKACVLDADALTSFENERERLFDMTKNAGDCLLTPHEGEFGRLFGHLAGQGGDKVSRTRMAAHQSGAVVLLKGADTVVAAPDGRASILTKAPATLATAGSGDVLAGIALGLIAQSMPVFEAASAAAWLHAEAAKTFGAGLIAEDLSEMLPSVLTHLETVWCDHVI